MANEQNLIPFNERTESERRKIQSEGGKASGAARRRKRSLREAADLFLSLPVSGKGAWNKLSAAGVAPEDIDNQMAIIAGLTARAANGDAKAAKVLFDLFGEDDRLPESAVEEDGLSRSLRELGKELESDEH